MIERAIRLWFRDRAWRSEPQLDRHPTELDLASWLDGAVAPKERGRLAEHLADCRACRELVSEVGRLQAVAAPDRDWRSLAQSMATAAAARTAPSRASSLTLALAAALVVVLGAAVWVRVVEAPGATRQLSQGTASDLPLVRWPTEGARLMPGDELRWAHTAGARLYEVQVVTRAGDPVWAAHAESPHLTLPVGTLAPGERYYVWVKALLVAGKTARSPAVAFEVGNVAEP